MVSERLANSTYAAVVNKMSKNFTKQKDYDQRLRDNHAAEIQRAHTKFAPTMKKLLGNKLPDAENIPVLVARR